MLEKRKESHWEEIEETTVTYKCTDEDMLCNYTCLMFDTDGSSTVNFPFSETIRCWKSRLPCLAISDVSDRLGRFLTASDPRLSFPRNGTWDGHDLFTLLLGESWHLG